MYSIKKNDKTLKLIWFGLFIAIFIYLFVLYIGPAGLNYSVEDTSYTTNSFFKTLMMISAIPLIFSYLGPKYLASKITNHDYSVPYIIKWACADAIAVIGFVIGHQLQSLSAYQPFLIISIMIMLNSYPKIKNI